MNGPLAALALFALLVALWAFARVHLASPVLLGVGSFGLVWGFAAGHPWLMIGGFVACGGGVFVHEVRVWERKARARGVAAEDLAGHDTRAGAR